ncbi:DUF2914 domain-containing protein [Candidatus Gracilibacteria bacterium]|nr:DUF2914 domain-containing protein [Candidatus Gracilibacteria bacterium]MCF7898635.1 DUF2914 domain-containing protein [Candidatus Paceibacterota bacterium]
MTRRLSTLDKYSAHTTTIIFIAGFIFDMIILPDIDHPITRYIGLAHLCTVAFLIMFREWMVSRNTASSFEQKVYSFSSFGIALSSGAALSFILIYAIRSAALSVSWPLFLILLICIVANELVSSHAFRFTLDVGVLLTATLFFTIFNVPVLVKTQNDNTFLLSIVIAICISLLYLFLLQFTSESAKNEASRTYALAIGIPMFVGMLYILNVIPAVPLSLKHSGIYHNIVRSNNGEFIAQEEKISPSFFNKFSYFATPVYYMTPYDTGVYFFSAVGAPAELTAPITHVWEQYDEATKKWIPRTTVSFTLEGGRDNGYRAYSVKENIPEGLWRVNVKVDSNRIVGRVKFLVKFKGKVELQEVVL